MKDDPAEGMFLHASSVRVDGGAFLFLGHSTAGKSTLARLLGGRCPVLADDSVFVRPAASGGWRVVDGGFRHEHGDVSGWQAAVRRRSAEGGAFRLAGCARIHKAESVRLEPLAPLELARCLMDAAMEVDVQRKFGRVPSAAEAPAPSLDAVRRMRRFWFRRVAEIARTCPAWHLWFPKDASADALLETLSEAVKASRGS